MDSRGGRQRSSAEREITPSAHWTDDLWAGLDKSQSGEDQVTRTVDRGEWDNVPADHAGTGGGWLCPLDGDAGGTI